MDGRIDKQNEDFLREAKALFDTLVKKPEVYFPCSCDTRSIHFSQYGRQRPKVPAKATRVKAKENLARMVIKERSAQPKELPKMVDLSSLNVSIVGSKGM